MQYDPIKKTLGGLFSRTIWLRVLFYKMLDLRLLRSWHIRKALKEWYGQREEGQLIALDAGSGFGQYTYRMAQLSSSVCVDGVDVKEEQVRDCNDFFQKLGFSQRVRFEVQDLTKYIKESTYDLILSIDVMEHILEDELVFNNFYHSMRKGGMLLISTPSDLGGSDADEHEEGAMHGFIDEHVRDGYNAQDIREKLQRAGFSGVDVRYSYGTAGHLSWVMSMKWPIQMLGLSKAFFVILPLYYLVLFPWCLVLNMIDLYKEHGAGTGLIVRAFKE